MAMLTEASLNMTTRTSHPLSSRAIRIYVWILLSAFLVVQAAAVWAIHVRTGQLSDFGRFYYAVDAWRSGAGGLYQPNFATPIVIEGQTFEMTNVASPLWHVIAWPFTYV